MSPRAVALILPLALLAGCATTPRTTYHYDGQGDYYTGVTPGADVIVTSPGYSGWGHGGWGYGGYGYGSGYYGSPWSAGYGGGFGYGYGYSPWWGWGGAHHYVPQRPDYPRTARRDRPDRWDFPPRRDGDSGNAALGVKRSATSLPASAGYAPDRARADRMRAAPRSEPALGASRAQPALGSPRAVSPRPLVTPPPRPASAPMRAAPPPMRAPQPSFERSAPPPSRAASKRE
jgi:hypothetical protein